MVETHLNKNSLPSLYRPFLISAWYHFRSWAVIMWIMMFGSLTVNLELLLRQYTWSLQLVRMQTPLTFTGGLWKNLKICFLVQQRSKPKILLKSVGIVEFIRTVLRSLSWRRRLIMPVEYNGVPSLYQILDVSLYSFRCRHDHTNYHSHFHDLSKMFI